MPREPKTFDFRPGRNRWGHALHETTFKAAEPRRVKQGLFRKDKLIDRVSVMVHCQGPEIGDFVLYTGSLSLRDRRSVIVDIYYWTGVSDQYTLTLEEAPND